MAWDSIMRSLAEPLETLRLRLEDARGRGPYAGYPNEHQCVFIHVPKTAGTAVVRALFNSPSRHVPCTVYRRANPRKFRDFFKFAFVRNPWDRIVSSFFYLKGGGQHEEDRLWAHEHLGRFESFDTFVREWVAQGHISRGAHFRPQTDFICHGPNEPALDFLGRFENLTLDFYRVAGRLGKNVLLRQSNVAPHEHYTKYYTPDTIEIVARAYARDIVTLGYFFDGKTS